MGGSIEYNFTVNEVASESFLSKILNFYQNFMRKVMSQNDLDTAIIEFTEEIRKWHPICVFDFDPRSGNLMNGLKRVFKLEGLSPFIYWKFALPFRFQVKVKQDYQVEINFILEVHISSRSYGCVVSHEIWLGVLEGRCYDEEAHKDYEDYEYSILDACEMKVREVLSDLFLRFEREFPVIAKEKRNKHRDILDWDL